MPDKSNSVTFFALNTAKMGSSLRGSLLSSVININLLALSVFRVKEMPNCLIAACKISAASTPSVSPPSHSLSSLFFLSFFLKPPQTRDIARCCSALWLDLVGASALKLFFNSRWLPEDGRAAREWKWRHMAQPLKRKSAEHMSETCLRGAMLEVCGIARGGGKI